MWTSEEIWLEYLRNIFDHSLIDQLSLYARVVYILRLKGLRCGAEIIAEISK